MMNSRALKGRMSIRRGRSLLRILYPFDFSNAGYENLVGLGGFESDESYDSRPIEKPVHHALLFRQR